MKIDLTTEPRDSWISDTLCIGLDVALAGWSRAEWLAAPLVFYGLFLPMLLLGMVGRLFGRRPIVPARVPPSSRRSGE